MDSILSSGVWFLLFCGLTFVLHEVYGPLLKRQAFKVFTLPGLATILAFKLLCCYMTGTKVEETRLLADDKEIIKHGEPRIGWPGRLVIAVVPFFCMLLLFCVINAALGKPVVIPEPLPEFKTLFKQPGAFFGTFLDFILWFFSGLVERGRHGWGLWIMIALGLNLILAVAPTLRDFKYIIIAAAAVFLVAAGAKALGIGVTGRTEANSFIYAYVDGLGTNVKFLLGLGLIWLAASAITVGSWRLYLTAAEKNKKKDDKKK